MKRIGLCLALCLLFGCQGEGGDSSSSQERPQEDCGDGEDNNRDGWIDCDDRQCWEHPHCQEDDGGQQGQLLDSAKTPGGDSEEAELTEEEAVCERWMETRENLSEGRWTGSVSRCDAGDIVDEGRTNALRLVNFYRWLGDLPEVSTASSADAAAQDCALIMTASRTLTHYPDASMPCYSASGADSAGKSNIASCAGVCAVDLYMVDPGNASTLGHRRWILSDSLGPIGLGSTDDYSCMQVIGGSGSAGQDWTAFPPPGVVPAEMWFASGYSMDDTGWSLQSDRISLSGARVTVTRDDGAELPMTVRSLSAYYGSTYAISMIPEGWSTEPDRSYTVTVSGISETIQYTVEPRRCEAR